MGFILIRVIRVIRGSKVSQDDLRLVLDDQQRVEPSTPMKRL